MLRWWSLRRAVKIIKYPHSVASSTGSGAGVEPEEAKKFAVIENEEKPKVAAAPLASLKESVTTEPKVAAASVASLKESVKTKPKPKVATAQAASLKKTVKAEPKVARVTAPFASLKKPTKSTTPPQVEDLIAKATNVDALLSVTENDNHVSKDHALKIVAKLADWIDTGKIKMSDFEYDIRYAKICQSLGQKGTGRSLDDLFSEENAAKLISSISLPQMVKVLNNLAIEKRRSTPVLKSLAFNIGKSTETLKLKQAADVFYACALLNFPDEVLLAKVIADITKSLKNANSKDKKKPDVVSSIVTSVGILKYKDIELLENLSNWIVKNSSICQAKQYISLVLTLANVNYIPKKFSSLHQLLKPFLNEREMTNQQGWLDLVWSLVVLQKYDEDLSKSVLNPTFIDKLKSSDGSIHIVNKMKLLNINGAVQQLGSSLLPKTSNIFDVPLVRTKDKQASINCIKDTLIDICDVSQHFKTDVNTDMGFLIDFECQLNTSSQLIEISEWSKETSHKVALMALDYHDVCRGKKEDPHGRTALYYRLLEKAGYNVIIVPFYEFSPKDELKCRVSYLQNKLKSCIERKS